MGALLRRFGREGTVLLLFGAAFLLCSRLSPYFLDAAGLLDASTLYMEAGIVALGMTFVIIGGQIDLSVASNMALTGACLGVLHARTDWPLPAAIACALLIALGMGLANGLLVARLRLPSLTVTLGTFALYRGIAQILVGEQSISGFPEWFVGIDRRYLGPLPLPLAVFLGLALLFALVLHYTLPGRRTYAVGANPVASHLSGVPVARVTLGLFALSGALAGLAGVMMTSRLSVARWDSALGLELDVITAVVLGGTDIFGGRGTIFGTVVALLLVAMLRHGMSLANIKVERQLVAVGALLLIAIVVPNLMARLRARRTAPAALEPNA
jgi:rhamnose transport system permease protein